jgi:hypothetical protein
MNSTGFRASARACVSLLFVACLSGCTVSEFCELHNGSGSDLTIVRVQAGREEPPIHVEAGASILLSDWLSWEYRVTTGGKMLRYVPESPGTQFVVNRGFGPWTKRLFVAQIDSAGYIFVLNPGQSLPATEFVVQPSLFPLTPAISQ